MAANHDSSWDEWLDEAISKLESTKLLRSLRPITLNKQQPPCSSSSPLGHAYKVFDEMQQWDRSSVEVSVSDSTFHSWLRNAASVGEFVNTWALYLEEESGKFKKLLLFSGNDYLGLSSHPTIANAAAKAAQDHGMGPRGSALICGYTNYHRLLESALAELKKKEDCLLCPTGFSANMAVMVSIGSLGSLLAASQKKPQADEKIAVFSDALNHASIIDGIRLAERQQSIQVYVYRHCDMSHLSSLLSNCSLKKKVVVTDSLFSMDGDFAPMTELANLRKIHGFILIIDDAHGTFVCGKDGSGVAEQFNCESDVDICIGTLSKAAGCHGGFVACSKKWKQLIQSRGRSFIFSTAIPVPFAAAAHAAVIVARKEAWRRRQVWKRVQDFRDLTGIPITSPIISLVVGSEERALQASRYLLESGFHVTAIRPPTVPSNSCRLRVTLSATHTIDDLKKLTAAISRCITLEDISTNSNGLARL
ncbi:8-amino-7-oxononanoate synthase [Linum grandiflorum]